MARKNRAVEDYENKLGHCDVYCNNKYKDLDVGYINGSKE